MAVTFKETKPMNDGTVLCEIYCLASDTKPTTCNGKAISNGSHLIEQNGSTGVVTEYYRAGSSWKAVAVAESK